MRATCTVHLIFNLFILLIFFEAYKVMKLLIMQSSPTSHHFLSIKVQIFSPAFSSQTTSMYVLLLVWETKFHTHTKNR
jgi:hypothetical protein